VVDASAFVDYLLRTEAGFRVGETIEDLDVDLHVPAVCDLEVTAAVRRGLLMGALTHDRAWAMIEVYLDLPISRHSHRPLLGRVLQLRDNFTAYDAVYVALAERLRSGLMTRDAALARAARQRLGMWAVVP
jgi:predicted nucleic acid-binding protein